MTASPSGRLDPATAVEALETLKAEAVHPAALYRSGVTARESWKARVQGVLDQSFGPDFDLSEKMRSNGYSMGMWTDATPQSAFDQAHIRGIERAVGYVDTAIFQLGLMRDADRRRAETMAPAAHDSAKPNPRAVWVIHGRDLAVRTAMFEFLRALALSPVEWSQAAGATGRPAPYVGEVLKVAFESAQAVMVLLTPDDEARLRERFVSDSDPEHERNLTPQARPNVLFEAGMAMAWDENRTVLVEVGRCRPFSDIGGRHVLRFDGSSQQRQELAQRLESAGCEVDMTGTDWHTVGDFPADR